MDSYWVADPSFLGSATGAGALCWRRRRPEGGLDGGDARLRVRVVGVHLIQEGLRLRIDEMEVAP